MRFGLSSRGGKIKNGYGLHYAVEQNKWLPMFLEIAVKVVVKNYGIKSPIVIKSYIPIVISGTLMKKYFQKKPIAALEKSLD